MNTGPEAILYLSELCTECSRQIGVFECQGHSKPENRGKIYRACPTKNCKGSGKFCWSERDGTPIPWDSKRRNPGQGREDARWDEVIMAVQKLSAQVKKMREEMPTMERLLSSLKVVDPQPGSTLELD